jgi:predicted phosphoribosyltransferase
MLEIQESKGFHKCGDFYNNFPNNSLDHVAYYLEKREMENFGE